MNTTTAAVYGIPNCDTVKRARAWLQARGVPHEFNDFKKAPPSPAQLQEWAARVGWERLLNRQGSTWRQLDEAAKAGAADAAGACRLLAQQPSAIKRPVVQWPDGALTVGFDAEDWQRRLG